MVCFTATHMAQVPVPHPTSRTFCTELLDDFTGVATQLEVGTPTEISSFSGARNNLSPIVRVIRWCLHKTLIPRSK